MGVLQDNLVLSTELIICIGHRKEIRELTFRALALRWSKSRNCGLCVVYIQKCGATLSVGADTIVNVATVEVGFGAVVLIEKIGAQCSL